MLVYLSMLEEDGDRAEFVRIYGLYADAVFRRALAILKNQQDAEDAMQDTWMKVAENIGVLRGKEERTICAYVMKIATNHAITLSRARTRRDEILCDAPSEESVCDDDVFDICSVMAVEEIRACFEALPVSYRDVLSLYFFYQQSIKEIAVLLGMKPATVNSRLTRGRKKLIELLKERGYHG